MLLEGQELDQVIGLIGVPRSGTTMITSFLAVHSRIYAVYEPWNAVRHDGIRGRVRTINDFMRRFAPALDGKTILLIKETFTQPRYVEALGALLKTVRPPLARRLLVTLRNPFHVFLSEFEARRKWWGHTDLVLSALLFDDWAHKGASTYEIYRPDGAPVWRLVCFIRTLCRGAKCSEGANG